MSYLLENQTVEQHLLALLPRANRSFSVSLHPGVDNVLGLRVPDVRDLARRIVKSRTWEAYLSSAGTHYMEERMLHGLVLSLIPTPDVEEYLHRVSRFATIINSWSVCDVFDFSGRRHFVARNADRIWSFLCRMMESEREYEVRFGVVMSMQYFIDENHILSLLDRYASIRHEGYYAQMGVAWAVAECFIKQPDVTLPVFGDGRLPNSTHNKAIQKICESLRVNKATKQMLKNLKRK